MVSAVESSTSSAATEVQSLDAMREARESRKRDETRAEATSTKRTRLRRDASRFSNRAQQQSHVIRRRLETREAEFTNLDLTSPSASDRTSQASANEHLIDATDEVTSNNLDSNEAAGRRRSLGVAVDRRKLERLNAFLATAERQRAESSERSRVGSHAESRLEQRLAQSVDTGDRKAIDLFNQSDEPVARRIFRKRARAEGGFDTDAVRPERREQEGPAFGSRDLDTARSIAESGDKAAPVPVARQQAADDVARDVTGAEDRRKRLGPINRSGFRFDDRGKLRSRDVESDFDRRRLERRQVLEERTRNFAISQQKLRFESDPLDATGNRFEVTEAQPGETNEIPIPQDSQREAQRLDGDRAEERETQRESLRQDRLARVEQRANPLEENPVENPIPETRNENSRLTPSIQEQIETAAVSRDRGLGDSVVANIQNFADRSAVDPASSSPEGDRTGASDIERRQSVIAEQRERRDDVVQRVESERESPAALEAEEAGVIDPLSFATESNGREIGSTPTAEDLVRSVSTEDEDRTSSDVTELTNDVLRPDDPEQLSDGRGSVSDGIRETIRERILDSATGNSRDAERDDDSSADRVRPSRARIDEREGGHQSTPRDNRQDDQQETSVRATERTQVNRDEGQAIRPPVEEADEGDFRDARDQQVSEVAAEILSEATRESTRESIRAEQRVDRDEDRLIGGIEERQPRAIPDPQRTSEASASAARNDTNDTRVDEQAKIERQTRRREALNRRRNESEQREAVVQRRIDRRHEVQQRRVTARERVQERRLESEKRQQSDADQAAIIRSNDSEQGLTTRTNRQASNPVLSTPTEAFEEPKQTAPPQVNESDRVTPTRVRSEDNIQFQRNQREIQREHTADQERESERRQVEGQMEQSIEQRRAVDRQARAEQLRDIRLNHRRDQASTLGERQLASFEENVDTQEIQSKQRVSTQETASPKQPELRRDPLELDRPDPNDVATRSNVSSESSVLHEDPVVSVRPQVSHPEPILELHDSINDEASNQAAARQEDPRTRRDVQNEGESFDRDNGESGIGQRSSVSGRSTLDNGTPEFIGANQDHAALAPVFNSETAFANEVQNVNPRAEVREAPEEQRQIVEPSVEESERSQRRESRDDVLNLTNEHNNVADRSTPLADMQIGELFSGNNNLVGVDESSTTLIAMEAGVGSESPTVAPAPNLEFENRTISDTGNSNASVDRFSDTSNSGRDGSPREVNMRDTHL